MLNKAEKIELKRIQDRISSWGSDEFTQTHRLVPETEIQHVLGALGAMVGPAEADMDEVETIKKAQQILDGGGLDG